MNKLLSSLALALAATLPLPGAAYVLSLQPALQSTTVGGSATVNLLLTGLQAGDEIASAYDLRVRFDPTVLHADLVSVSSLNFVTPPLFDADFSTPGEVGVQVIGLDGDDELAALQGDSVVLSSIRFTGLADGFSLLSFGPDPDFDRNVVGRDALSLPLTVQGACVAVGSGSCELPEPASLALVGVALAGALGAGLRRRGTA